MDERITLLPVGCVEAHGHLPPDTDTLIARAFCELLKPELNAVVAEPIDAGFCPTTASLPGTVFMPFRDVLARVLGRIQDLVNQGHRFIIAVNIHADNDSVLTAAVLPGSRGGHGVLMPGIRVSPG